MMIQLLLRTVFRLTKSTVVILTTSTVLVFLLSKLPFAPDYTTVNERGTNSLPIPLFRGSLQENDILSQASKLFHGQLQGPETLVPHEGYLYFGVGDGSILRKSLDHDNDLEVVVNSSRISGDSKCIYSGPSDQINCGRHLGIRFDSKGFLYGLEAYTGIYQVDVKKKAVTKHVFDATQVGSESRKIVFLDDFSMDEGSGSKGGNVYYLTDSSKNWVVDYVSVMVLLKDATGRIIRFDEDTGKVEPLLEDLLFPNGIELTDDKTAVLFNELSTRKTWKYYIKGSNRGKKEIMCPNLPGYPDNLRRSARRDKETYWIAFYEAMNPEKPNHVANFAERNAKVTEVALRALFNLGKIMMDVGSWFSFQPLIDIGFYTKTVQFHQKWDLLSKGLAIEVDLNCNILRSAHSPDGRVTHLSEVREVIEANGQSTLYMGSYYNNYLGKLSLDSK